MYTSIVIYRCKEKSLKGDRVVRRREEVAYPATSSLPVTQLFLWSNPAALKTRHTSNVKVQIVALDSCDRLPNCCSVPSSLDSGFAKRYVER